MAPVARSIGHGAEEFAEETLGITIRRLARALFPEQELRAVANQLRDRPEEFEAEKIAGNYKLP